MNFEVDAAAGIHIPRIFLTEEGDSLIDDFGLPTGSAATTVVANAFVDTLEIDGVSVTGLNANSLMNFTSMGTFETTSEGNGNHAWSGLLSLNLDNVITDAGLSGHATRVQVSLSNTLTAFADNGAVAFIQKNNINGLAVKVVPEPGTAVLMGVGLAGMAARPRRRS